MDKESGDDHVDPVVQQFLDCPIQQLACNTLIGEILDCELHWATGKRVVKLPENHQQITLWQNAIKRIIRQFMMFGYVVYRMAKVSAASPGDLLSADNTLPSASQNTTNAGAGMSLKPEAIKSAIKSGYKLEIMPGDAVCLKWIKRSSCFVAVPKTGDSDGDAGRASFVARQGNFAEGVPNKWRLQLMEPPIITGSGNGVVQQSASSRSYASSLLHSQLMEHVEMRDATNSRPSVFTTVSDRLKTGAGAQLKPWFDTAAAHGSMVARPGPGASVLDFEQLVSNRLETITSLQKMSAQARSSTNQLYANATSAVGSRSLHEPPPQEQIHDEMLVTDGMQFTQLDYRRAPEDLLQLLEKAVNDVLFQFSVPPQVLGKNINSERLASSNRLSELAVRRYSVSVKVLRDNLQICLGHISSVIGNGATIQLHPCISTFTLTQIVPLLTPEAAIKFYACAYDVDASAFSEEAVRDFLDVQRQGGKKNSSPDGGASASALNTPPDADQRKLDKSRKKALKPSASTDAKG